MPLPLDAPTQLNNTSDVEVPEGISLKKPLRSVSTHVSKMHTRHSKKAHEGLEHAVKHIDSNSTTFDDAQRQSMLILVQQALELMRLSLAAPKP